MHVARWLPRVLAIALLLLGGSLVVRGLFLQWVHLTFPDGSPFPDPAEAVTVTPADNGGFSGSGVQLLLGCAGFAVAAGLVALFLSMRPPGWLRVPLILLAVLMVAPTPLWLITHGGRFDVGVELECVIGVGVGLVVLFLSARRFGWPRVLLVLLVVAAAAGCVGLLSANLLVEFVGPAMKVRDVGYFLTSLGYVLILAGDALVFWAIADAGTPSAVRQ
jgi:hypothetical protein